MPTYVIGHKNPDTDAICSAIAYADLLRRTSYPEAEAACCGEIPARTLFALEQAKLPAPRLVTDVRPTAAQICRRDVVTARTDDSFLAAFEQMRKGGPHSIPVLGDGGKLIGMLSLFKLVDSLLPSPESGKTESRRIESSLCRIAKTIGGRFQHQEEPGREEELLLVVAALSAEGVAARLRDYDAKKALVVMGDRPNVQREAIEYGVRALVVTGDNLLPDDLLALAKKNKVTVLVSPSDTATTTLLIKCARPISLATSREFVSFPASATVTHILATLETSAPQTLFPVIGEGGEMIGVFSKSELIDPPRTKLVLVDHNEWAQAVSGADEAEIVEVIDHHKLGGNLSSKHPIRFVNEPLGSTCTLIARFFRQAGIVPEPSIALAMAAGLISDTLFLTSPTTTPADKETLAWLEQAAKTDLKKFADAFFAAGSLLVSVEPGQAIRTDCKEYDENGWKIAVAQIEEQSLDNFWKKKDDLAAALETLRKGGNLDFACVLVTDITRHYSVLLTAGSKAVIGAIDYPKLEENLFELEGVVSRKKQLLPHLVHLLAKVKKG